MCASPVLAPHGCPEPPAPATRLPHYQSQPHDHSRCGARASVRLSLKSTPIAQAPALFFRHHAAPERDAPGRTQLHREARATHAARAGHHARAPLPACSEHSARVPRTAPLPPRASTTRILHRTRRARRTLRARSATRSVCCPACLHTAQSTGKVHVHAAQSTHSAAARTPRQSPASRRARACRTQFCARCIIWYFFLLSQKVEENTSDNTQEKTFAAPASTLEQHSVRSAHHQGASVCSTFDPTLFCL